MIYRFRVILDNDSDEDIFRDLEIKETDSLEDLHNIITQSFGFDGMEMASFYISDDQWNQGEEISMFEVNEGQSISRTMQNTMINDVVHEASPKLIYIYDFLNMWTFFVELAEIFEPLNSITYPNLMYVHGQIPDTAPEKKFQADELDSFDNFDVDDYENLDFDENWN